MSKRDEKQSVLDARDKLLKENPSLQESIDRFVKDLKDYKRKLRSPKPAERAKLAKFKAHSRRRIP